METILILYAVCASALLICSTSRRDANLHKSCGCAQRAINYVAIPGFVLHELAERHPDLVIFEMCTDGERNARRMVNPGALTVAEDELPHLLKWLPPRSTVVFSYGGGIRRFDAHIEATLLLLGIEVIYVLDDGVSFPLTITWEQRPLAGGR